MSPKSVARSLLLLSVLLVALALFMRTAHGARAPRDQPPSAPPSSAPATPSTPLTDATNPAVPSPIAPDTDDADLTKLPRGSGLPVMVNVATAFREVKSFDDSKGEFEAVTDLRLRWFDLRLRASSPAAAEDFKEFRGKDAEEQLAKIWVPHVEVTNRLEQADYVGRRLRIYPNGRVETIARTTARYSAHVDAQRFPFDRQLLPISLIVRDESTDEVMLEFDKDDELFSHVAHGASLDNWVLADVDLDADEEAGWNGDRYSRVTASLAVDRVPTTGLTAIFIPLVASLLIPLLALWMNRPAEEGFEIPAFELANMGIGGLFSVIALSFAVSSAYGVISGADNTVSRLFGLNYATLAISLGVVITFYRFNLPARLFGRYVEREMFYFLTWALPLLTLGTSIAFILVAAV